MNYTNISAALNQKLNAMPNLPTIIAWENVDISPVVDELYLRTALLPVPTQYPCIGQNTEAYEQGIFQIDVLGVAGEGRGVVQTKADAIVTYFARGTLLTYDSQNVRIERAYQSPGRQEDNRYKIPVNINYHAFV
jgi:hypothetical protein